MLVAVGLFLLISPATRGKIFVHKGKGIFIVFSVYTLIVAIIKQNFIGAACSLGFFFIIVVSYFVRSVVTEKVFDRCLDLCCYATVPIALCALVERLLSSADHGCLLWFFNENYFCSIMAACVIICGYKATNHKGPVLRYYICALFGVFAMYLGESMFAFVELFVGIIVLLILKHKHFMLATFLAVVVFGLVMIYFVPDLFPRLAETNITTDRRIRIWDTAMGFIKEEPIFGRGFLSYYNHAAEHPDVYQTTHAHNFAIEPLLSFGIIGTVMLLVFMWSYYSKVSECKELLRTNEAATLILTISAAVVAHTTTDLTLLWIQTGLLYALILGGIGIDEKTLHKRLLACVAKQNEDLSQKQTKKGDNNAQ